MSRPSAFANRILKDARRQGLLAGGEHVLVAVSGGADSMALLCSLAELARPMSLTLTVAHLNHGIRRDAAADADFVRAVAARLGAGYIGGRARVPDRVRSSGLSLEMAAREARHAFFRRAMAKSGADVVASGHTADDQAETLILRLARGAGTAGMAGMAPASDIGGLKLIRPLLGVFRSDIAAYLRARGECWREDDSNADTSIPRNRVRHVVLPLLEKNLNPSLRKTLLRMADVMREDDAHLERQAAELRSRCEDGAGGLGVAALRGAPSALRRRALRQWLYAGRAEPGDVDFDLVERISRLVEGARATACIDAGGGTFVERRGGRLHTRTASVKEPAPVDVRLRIPGVTMDRARGIRVTAERGKAILRERGGGAGRLPARATLRWPAAGEALVVRGRRPGDRMAPFGMTGTRKVQDILVDGRVPSDERDRLPILACGGDIVWIPGYRIARGWEVAPGAARMLQLTVEKTGER